jgi:hypothetical protein
VLLPQLVQLPANPTFVVLIHRLSLGVPGRPRGVGLKTGDAPYIAQVAGTFLGGSRVPKYHMYNNRLHDKPHQTVPPDAKPGRLEQ